MRIEKFTVILFAVIALMFSYSAFAEEEEEMEEVVVTGSRPLPNMVTWCGEDVCPDSGPPGYEPIEPSEELDEGCVDTARPVLTGPPIPMCNVNESLEDLLCSSAAEMAKQAAAAGGCAAMCDSKIKGTSKTAVAKRAACITGCTILVETAVLCE